MDDFAPRLCPVLCFQSSDQGQGDHPILHSFKTRCRTGRFDAASKSAQLAGLDLDRVGLAYIAYG